jgi:hypothetical protein
LTHTIFWNLNSFHLINLLRNACKFNASHSLTNILGPLVDCGTVQARASNWKLLIHAQSARTHVAAMTQQFLEQNAIKRALHPAYSSDLAPLDFDLFGYVKQLLGGQEFPDKEALVGVISAILGLLTKWTSTEYFSSGWREFVDVSTPLESTSTKLSLHVDRTA